MGLALCGRVEAATQSAELLVSVVVPDQCLVRSTSHSANCTGGAVYGVGISRERVDIASSDVLTGSSEHAHTPDDGPTGTISHSLSGDRGAVAADVSAMAVRLSAQSGVSEEAIRVTYSF